MSRAFLVMAPCRDRRRLKAGNWCKVACGILLATRWAPPTALLATDEDGSALLDQAAAAFDANQALIGRGVARYRTVETVHVPPRGLPTGARSAPPGKKADFPVRLFSEVTVFFDYPRVRFDWRGQRLTAQSTVVDRNEWTIFDGQQRIHYSYISKPRAPRDYRVRIDPRDMASAWHPAHPREQARRKWSFGTDALAEMRKNPEASLTAAKDDDGLVRVVLKRQVGTQHFWLSPAEAYSIVRSKLWRSGDAEDDEPYQVFEATFRMASNGAFVLENRVSHEMVFVDGVRKPSRDEELTLLEVDMRDDLDPKLFTLDGLGLPAGAFIIDAVVGDDYLYGGGQ